MGGEEEDTLPGFQVRRRRFSGGSVLDCECWVKRPIGPQRKHEVGPLKAGPFESRAAL